LIGGHEQTSSILANEGTDFDRMREFDRLAGFRLRIDRVPTGADQRFSQSAAWSLEVVNLRQGFKNLAGHHDFGQHVNGYLKAH
jgi:hypothetical protein